MLVSIIGKFFFVAKGRSCIKIGFPPRNELEIYQCDGFVFFNAFLRMHQYYRNRKHGHYGGVTNLFLMHPIMYL